MEFLFLNPWFFFKGTGALATSDSGLARKRRIRRNCFEVFQSQERILHLSEYPLTAGKECTSVESYQLELIVYDLIDPWRT